MMSVPLLSQDRVIGVLHFRSTRLGAYSEKDLKLAESIAAQIAGAIANAQLFQERKRAEESLRENEKAATRLAQENSIMAEIGQIISSTLNIGEVYERFAERVRTLIPFDRIAINIIDRENMNLIIPYVLGANVAEREVGKVVPLAGTGVEWVMQNRSSLLISEENCKETFDRFPGLFPIFQTGFQSAMLIPLFSKGQVIAVLNLQSFDKNGYTETYLKLAERVSVQIAGAIANAELFQERNRADKAFRESEDGAKRLAQENAVMAEIGRIISSTLDIEEVYERFAAEARKLIPFDRIAVSLNNPGGGSATITYASGVEFEGKHIGDVFPIAHSASQEAIRSRAGLLVQPEAVEELEGRFSGLIPTFQAGLRSMITVPLISRDQVIGALHLRSKKPKAWTDRDLRLTERIGAQIAGAIANAELFTQLRKAEEEVRAREVKFKDLYDSAPVGYHEYDTEGRITNVNRTNLEMLGYSREEMIGQYIWDFNVGGDIVRQQVLEKLKGLQPPARSLERTYRRKDGSTFPVLIEDRLNKDERGRITGIRSTIQDITERKRVEGELLRAKEAADAANKAKSEFLANMSHELRTPLNHIIGFTELVVDKQCGDLNEQQREYLNDALQSSRHLLSLINDVLDLSKVEAGKLQLEVAEIRLRELLQGSLSMVKEKAMKHRIRLLSDIDGIPEAIQADERKLKQILYNLLSNAVKFTPDGGSVVLSTRYLSFREGQWFSPDGQSVGLPLVGDDLVKKGKGLIEISVQDSGIGIKGEDLQRIFNPFEQVESSASRRYQGTGLGLSLTKRLVELHGGRIWAESEGEGKGSKFILLILV
jgi:PAS domain S-box-containing protein